MCLLSLRAKDGPSPLKSCLRSIGTTIPLQHTENITKEKKQASLFGRKVRNQNGLIKVLYLKLKINITHLSLNRLWNGIWTKLGARFLCDFIRFGAEILKEKTRSLHFN